VIVGGGFAGLQAAIALRRAPVRITLIDRRNFHLFQPLLYQVATGGLSPADIASPLRAILRKQRNAHVLQGEVTDVDVSGRAVLLDAERVRVGYDYLVVVTGATHHYFGHDAWASVAPGLKTIEDATSIRARILSAFEKAERETSATKRDALLTFVIVGGGPTGVELAGAIGELARMTLAGNFREIDPSKARILLLEGAGRLLLSYPEALARHAADSLESLGVTVETEVMVTEIRHGAVVVDRGGRRETIEAETILWAAGVEASPLGRTLAERTSAERDRAGRLVVGPDLSIPGHPEIFVGGDLAAFTQDGKGLPGIAPVAMQQGRYIASVIRARSTGASPPSAFRYRDKGSLAVIGRARAVALLFGLRFWGYPAWLLWLFVHLLYLVAFENRVIVLIQWAWSYVTRNRRARLITKPRSD
jgi:NADH:quinone reductase (non-electrogenic)